MRKTDSSETIIGCLAIVLAIPLLSIWNGYVLSVLWGWFVVSTFEVRPLSLLPAIGVAMVVSYLTHQQDEYTDPTKSQTDRIVQSIGMDILRPLMALVFGWILHSFM